MRRSAALQQGSGGLAELDHQPHGIVEERIVVVRRNFSRVVATAARRLAIFFRSLQEFLLILRLPLRLPEFHHRRDFFFRHVRSMQPMHARRARRQVKHVAASQQRFGAVGVENRARVDLGRHAERHARREVRLDQSGDDIDRRTLRSQHQVNAHRARHLRQARDRFFHVVAVEHHQVGQLVDDDDDLRNRPFIRIV
jgi:hypothetical protein